MKIALQGHPTREKEVIRILESLGGKKLYYSNASDKCLLFFIDDKEYISCIHHESPLAKECFKIYTLEEFEKEFPFKIGDEVIVLNYSNKKGTILNIVLRGPIFLYSIKLEIGNIIYREAKYLKPYKEMKKERNITLTLDKAQEWYNKGGELKEIALQAFTEQELNPLPRSWEEFCKKYPVKDKEAHIDSVSNIIIQKGDATLRYSTRDCNICPSKKSAEAHLAMIQLEQLRNCWWNGWKPDWNDDEQTKYCIVRGQEFKINMLYETRRFLSFPTNEMAREFLECFRDLIEKAEDLI
jgi:hypothetical protein